MLFCDLETFSPTKISLGAHKYAEDCEVLLFGWALDEEPAQVWDVTSGEPMPEKLKNALEDERQMVVWHNGLNFDTTVLRHAKNVHVDIPCERVIDTMVMAYELGLPGNLAQLCDIFKLPKDVAKDRDGRRLIMLFCQPHVSRKIDRATRETHPEDWAKFVNYCRLDVEAERALFHKMPKAWMKYRNGYPERRLQALDWKINNRGIGIDLELANKAVEADLESKAELTAEVQRRTEGEVQSAAQRDALLQFIAKQYGWHLDDMTRSTVEKYLDDPNLPDELRELLAIRLKTVKTSVRKYHRLIECSNGDGRLRGTMQFRGAARTGRWAGRLFQVQNLPRPSLKEKDVAVAVDVIKKGLATLCYDDVGEVLSSCIRSAIVAPEGKKLIDADFSSVESRVLAWLANERWKLKAFEALDRGEGFDPYQHAYAMTFNVPVDTVTKKQRQMGKPIELGMGFGGGVGAFLTFARAYGIDLSTLGGEVYKSIDRGFWLEAEDMYQWALEKDMLHGLEHDTWCACEAIKRKWRYDNASIVRFWADCAEGCVKAIECKDTDVPIGDKCVARREKNYLYIYLPSGRPLVYPAPSGSDKGDFSYMGVNQYTRKFERIHTHGGKVAENITQAVACDLLANSLMNLEEEGYEPVMHIHDEIVCEVPDDGTKTVKEMERIMGEAPSWAEGLPLRADGWEGKRFKKED